MNTKESEAIKLEYIGSISEGTMRADDLIPKFLDVVEEMAKRLDTGDIIAEVRDLRQQYNNLSDDSLGESQDDWDYLLNEEIWPLMESLAPDGYYFGAHPGDGSDYGFWRCEDDE